MQSLRTRRPTTNVPVQRSPTKLAKKPTEKQRDVRKSRVDDKIKKRMSMRYADISAPTPTDNVPAVPALPIGVRPHHMHSGSRGSIEMVRERQKEDAAVAENRLLDKQDFDPDACEWHRPM